MTWKQPQKINYNRLISLVEQVPDGLDIHSTKETISKDKRQLFYSRDLGVCFVCGLKGEYGSQSQYVNMTGRHNLHHIIPNGSASEKNIVTLCINCHRIVHNLLYIRGKWKNQNI